MTEPAPASRPAKIPIAGPWITEKEIEYVTDAVKTGWYGEANTYQQRFEEAFGNYVSRRHAMALPPATSAIHRASRSRRYRGCGRVGRGRVPPAARRQLRRCQRVQLPWLEEAHHRRRRHAAYRR